MEANRRADEPFYCSLTHIQIMYDSWLTFLVLRSMIKGNELNGCTVNTQPLHWLPLKCSCITASLKLSFYTITPVPLKY